MSNNPFHAILNDEGNVVEVIDRFELMAKIRKITARPVHDEAMEAEVNAMWDNHPEAKDLDVEQVEAMIKRLNETREFYERWIIGEDHRGRPAIIECPRVGDNVSYAFNGDATSDGHITKISASKKVITTSTGNKYYRQGKSATWKRSGTWSLIQGHHDKRNPHL